MRGRVLGLAGILGAALVLGSGAPALAAGQAASPAPAATLPAPAVGASPAPGRAATPASAPRCKVTDPRLAELSGLVVIGERMLAMSDGGDHVAVYLLDQRCRIVEVHTAPVDPYDPEDLAVAADRTVWLSDTGDNRRNRATVALIALHPDGSTGVYRMTYPDGPHDAEALLLAADGTPYVVTKELTGISGVYRPLTALVRGGTVRLGKVSTVRMRSTGTPGGPVGPAGQLMITGGAISADGHRLVLRTYTDAYVWPLSGSDVVAALMGAPQRIPLPPSPQGEAISFSADSRSLIVASEQLPSAVTQVALPVPVAGRGVAVRAPVSLTDLTRSGLSPITSGAIAACVATVVVWLGGRFRRPRSGAAAALRRDAAR
ncbi:MAG: hypothetical protein QOJ68_1732 [Blastococcus sp.]|jgi:hypothetical protein|nr:hypothetical protein [Blastococcus sp.]